MKRLKFLFGAAALFAVVLTASPALSAQENGNRDMNGKIVRGRALMPISANGSLLPSE